MYDWGDLKYFLAVARAGSTLAAARALGVNQTTVARRIAALEADLKLRLFDRNQDGYRLSENGALMLAQAERVAMEAETLEQFIARRERELCGTIRLTMAEGVATLVITPLLGEFMDLYPDIKVEVIAIDRRLDLLRGEADIAIRAGHLPTEAGLVVRKLADGPWSLYCSRTYGKKRGVPASADELNDHVIIGSEGALAKLEPHIWLTKVASRAVIRSVCSTNINMMAAIKAGHGIGALPCSMGIVDPELVECFHLSQFKYHYYLVMPEVLKDLPRIRAFNEFLNCRATEVKKALEGRLSLQPRVISSAGEGAT